MSPLSVLTPLAAVFLASAAPAADPVQVLGLFKDRAVIQVGAQQRLLRAGETSPEGVTLISASPREAVLEVAGERGTYALGSRISTAFASAEDRGPAVQLWPGTDGMYTASGSINGLPVTFLVDTGATKVALNANLAKRLGIDYRVVGKPSMAATASGVVQSYDVVLQRVTVGEIELSGIEAGVIDGPHPREALLGMSFLQRLDMTRKGRLLELRKRP
jgi:aspartyl protease family protein